MNDLPYSDGSSLLSPNMILHPTGYLGSFNLRTDIVNVNTMFNQVRDFVTLFVKFKKEEIIKDSEKLLDRKFRDTNKNGQYEVEVGDLVFIKEENKFDDFLFGLVKELNGSNAVLDTKKGIIEYPVCLLKIYSPVKFSKFKNS